MAVLGGGQLGLMLGLAGIPLGARFRFLDPSPDAPARAVGELVVGELGDDDALERTVDSAQVVTYEWEGVPADAACRLEARGHRVYPSTRALEVAQDRLSEKQTFRDLGIGVPEFAAVDDLDGLRAAVEHVGLPAILKTRRGGYDGKGQRVLTASGDVEEVYTALAGDGPLILEAQVPFERELSMLAVRGVDGTTRSWPLVENRHEGGILRSSRAPASMRDPALQARGEQYAQRLLDHFDYVGVLALELFEVDGTLLANEMAPRVHNSGHWTIEGAQTSQFENHLRAVLGWPLGPTDLRGPTAMVNCIGALPDPRAVLAIDGAHLHRYAKLPRRGRKVGHVTLTAPDGVELASRMDRLRSILPPEAG